MSNKNNRGRSTGWARTKKFPHARHPAFYKKKSKNNEIEYITFTHSDEVDFDSDNENKPIEHHDIVKPRKLSKNISKNKGDKKDSYVVPRVYEGQRSALGQNTDEFGYDNSDKAIIDDVFNNAPRYKVPFTSNSNKKISDLNRRKKGKKRK